MRPEITGASLLRIAIPLVLIGWFLLTDIAGAAGADGFAVDVQPDKLVITHSGRAVAEYVFRDERILRPYLARVHAPGGLPVTRNHPPVSGQDATDHDLMHPGIWLAWGDVNGHDFWRNKGRIEHVEFSDPPVAKPDRVAFTAKSKLLAPGNQLICKLTSRLEISARPAGWLLVWDATLHASGGDVSFGDQEEMGFGVRMATPLTEKNGGVIVNSQGKRTAGKTWGQPAAWCDYSGGIDGRQGGITLMAGPKNFRESWWHNRDYGLMVANPFGREAMKQGEKSTVTIKAGDTLRLNFAACLHDRADYDPAQGYEDFLESLR